MFHFEKVFLVITGVRFVLFFIGIFRYCIVFIFKKIFGERKLA